MQFENNLIEFGFLLFFLAKKKDVKLKNIAPLGYTLLNEN